jgi:acyl-coenzyme A thioesterase PaaI-like protein
MKFEGNIEFTIAERSQERVESEMPVRSGIKNPFGVVHAGAPKVAATYGAQHITDYR